MIWLFPFLAVALLYVGILIFNASLEAKHAPRTPMFVCDKHGPIPESVLLHLEGVTEKPIQYCPFCWQDKSKEIKEKGLPTKINIQ